MPFLVRTNISDSKTILKPFLLRIESDIRFLQISRTCSISFRVSSFSDVHFSMTLPFPSTLEMAELPMKSCSSCSSFWYSENNIFSEHICWVAPVSTHQFLLLVVRFTSDTIADRLGNAWLVRFVCGWSFFFFLGRLRYSFALCPSLLPIKQVPLKRLFLPSWSLPLYPKAIFFCFKPLKVNVFPLSLWLHWPWLHRISCCFFLGLSVVLLNLKSHNEIFNFSYLRLCFR